MSPLPTKLLMNWEDITTDHRDVPAKNPFVMKQCFGFLLGFRVSQAVLLLIMYIANVSAMFPIDFKPG